MLLSMQQTARCSQEMFEPAGLRLDDRGKVFALLLTSGSKRLQSDSVAYVRSLKRRFPSEIKDIELEVALKAHHYGGLVNSLHEQHQQSDDWDTRMERLDNLLCCPHNWKGHCWSRQPRVPSS